MAIVALLLAVPGLTGCMGAAMRTKPSVRIHPVATFEGKQVCVLENPSVRAGFLAAYKKTLEDRGYDVRVLPETAQLSTCLITSRYVAHWGGMINPSITHADLRVYNKGELAGRATYGGDMITGTEELIRELVTRLFPQ